MFNKVKLETFEGEYALISWDLHEGEIERMHDAIKAGRFGYAADFGMDEDCLSGAFTAAGSKFVVFTQVVGDLYNDFLNPRWTFMLPIRREGERITNCEDQDRSVAHMWLDFAPLMRALRPFMSDVAEEVVDPQIDAIPVTAEEIFQVFQTREDQYAMGNICINDGAVMWGIMCRLATNPSIESDKARAARALHILTQHAKPAGVIRKSYCRDRIAA